MTRAEEKKIAAQVARRLNGDRFKGSTMLVFSSPHAESSQAMGGMYQKDAITITRTVFDSEGSITVEIDFNESQFVSKGNICMMHNAETYFVLQKFTPISKSADYVMLRMLLANAAP